MSWEKVAGVHPLALILTMILGLVFGRVLSDSSLDPVTKTFLIFYFVTVFVCSLLFEYLRSETKP